MLSNKYQDTESQIWKHFAKNKKNPFYSKNSCKYQVQYVALEFLIQYSALISVYMYNVFETLIQINNYLVNRQLKSKQTSKK